MLSDSITLESKVHHAENNMIGGMRLVILTKVGDIL